MDLGWLGEAGVFQPAGGLRTAQPGVDGRIEIAGQVVHQTAALVISVLRGSFKPAAGMLGAARPIDRQIQDMRELRPEKNPRVSPLEIGPEDLRSKRVGFAKVGGQPGIGPATGHIDVRLRGRGGNEKFCQKSGHQRPRNQPPMSGGRSRPRSSMR